MNGDKNKNCNLKLASGFNGSETGFLVHFQQKFTIALTLRSTVCLIHFCLRTDSNETWQKSSNFAKKVNFIGVPYNPYERKYAFHNFFLQTMHQ